MFVVKTEEMIAYDVERDAEYIPKKIQSTLYIIIRPPLHRLVEKRLLRFHQLFIHRAPIYDGDCQFRKF